MNFLLVGGAVRDQLMGFDPKDRDYVVLGSTPDEMLAQGFEQVGAAFPVFLKDGEEYALARTETKTGEGYQGFSCAFGPEVTLEEDLARRDLTINSIACDPISGEYFDPYNGRADIASKTLRHTSAAFAEDPLRVIRLARFYARFDNFSVAPDTVTLACKIVASGEMDALSFERYWVELNKVMRDETPRISRFMQALFNFGALDTCAFFKDIFGSERWLAEVLNVLMSRYERGITRIALKDPDLAVAVLVALFEDSAPLAHQAVPTRVTRLVKNFRAFEMDNDSCAVYNALAATRSLSEKTEALTDLVACLQAAGHGDRAEGLLTGFDIVSDITAEPFMHLSGAEIGKALKQARLAALVEEFGE
jgi:tRNA nucleotidyltransferase/poly(A) polymerase